MFAETPKTGMTQHTEERKYVLYIYTRDRMGRIHTRHANKPYIYTHAQLVRLIADKHAKGYRLATLERGIILGEYSFILDVNDWHYPYVGSPALMYRAGRCMTGYAPAQEERA